MLSHRMLSSLLSFAALNFVSLVDVSMYTRVNTIASDCRLRE
jgi:hypothetical protein